MELHRLPTVAALFQKIGAPFIAAISGHAQMAVNLMEDTELKTTCSSGFFVNGRIPCDDRAAREKQIAVFIALQIAGGVHSMLEGFLVARGMGYFEGLMDLCPQA